MLIHVFIKISIFRVGCRVVELRLLIRWFDRACRVSALRKVLRCPSLHVIKFRRKPRENSERLGRQARPGIESDTSLLPFFSAEPLGHWLV